MDTESSDETSSDYTTESSDDDGMETAEVNGARLALPQGLCEHKEIFNQVLSSATWNSLSEENRQHLQKFLPTFPENDEQEKNTTLQRLFDRESFRFESPLEKFHEHLKAGYFRSDIANLRRLVARIERQEANYRYKKYREKLRQDVVESQRKLVEQINNLPPGVEPKCEKPVPGDSAPTSDSIVHRTKRRYFQVIGNIQAKLEDGQNSPDENYPEGPPASLSRKQRRHLNSIRNSFTTANPDLFVSTTSSKLNNLDLDRHVTPSRNPFYITDDTYKTLVLQHKRRKLETGCYDEPELNTKGITLNDVIGRTELPFVKSSTGSTGAAATAAAAAAAPSSATHHHHHRHHHHKNHSESKSRRKQPSSSKKQQPTTPSVVPPPPTSDPMRLLTTAHNPSLNHNSPLSSNSEGSDSDSVVVDAPPPVVPLPPKPKRPKRPPRPRPEAAKKQPPVAAAVTTAVPAPPPPLPPPPPPLPPTAVELPRAVTPPPPPRPEIVEIPPPHPPTPPLVIPPPPVVVAPPPPPPPLPPPPQQSSSSSSSATSFYGTPVTISDLEGIDMMEIPIDLDDTDIDILELNANAKPELMQETHSNFLSLIRDVICSTSEHRMGLCTLEERLKLWQENPISPLNDWYHLSDNWAGLLKSAVEFLCGSNNSEQPEDFVPYMEFKPQIDVYQWIGAGRDSDSLLAQLCQYWLEHRNEQKSSSNGGSSANKDKPDEFDVEVSDRAQTPPPPRCPTTWTVRKATPDEVKDFREQERRRYDNPHKAFTYRCNGFESVVGPLKGIYNASTVGSNAKARGHNMLNADRPNFVTILSLVRDATARLPNGEGTRADICELLKSSQYISSSAPDNVLQSVVSGALDRMHTQYDPCVKYDSKRKIWIYLHRNRSEEDFERIHQQCQGVPQGKTKKTPAKKPSGTPKPKTAKAEKTIKSGKEGATAAAAAAAAAGAGNAVVAGAGGTATTEKATPVKVKAKVQVVTQTTNEAGGVISIAGPLAAGKNNSLLIANQDLGKTNIVVQQQQQQKQHHQRTQEEKEINEALQAIVQNRVSSPTTIKIAAASSPAPTTTVKAKSLVKIISPATGGKSLIIPASNSAAAAQILKQVQEQQQRATTPKQITPAMAQQLLLSAKQKQQTIQIVKQQQQQQQQSANDSCDVKQQQLQGETPAKPTTTTAQFIQSITPQQLQNIKNVTLVRSVAAPGADGKTTAGLPEQIQIKTQAALTPAQQQQIIQTIKQKMFPQGTLINATTAQQGGQQQTTQHIILKQQKPGGMVSLGQKTATGASLLGAAGQAKIIGAAEGSKGVTQTPVMAKVLTNAAGQVISVESLLAHQKQHGSLPQGTTLRVSGTKGGQANIIQLTGTAGSKQNALAQFVAASQNNIIAITSQPKLVVSTQSLAALQTTSVTASTTQLTNVTGTAVTARTIGRGTAAAQRVVQQQQQQQQQQQNVVMTASTATAGGATSVGQVTAKFAPKMHAQQLINAKLMTSAATTTPDGQLQQQQQQTKIVQPKIFAVSSAGGGQQTQQVKLTAGGKNISLSKPVTLTNANAIRMVNAANLNLTHIGGKPVLLAGKGIQGQNVILQSAGNQLVLQNASALKGSTVIPVSTAAGIGQQQGIVQLGGHQLKVQTAGTASAGTQQVVFSPGTLAKGTAQATGAQTMAQGQPQHIVLDGQTVRLQAAGATAGGPQRVVLASQGQGGQIVAQQFLLPAGFQGTAINIKSLQGVKVIPLQQGRGLANRQVFARVMSPAMVKATAAAGAATIAAPVVTTAAVDKPPPDPSPD